MWHGGGGRAASALGWACLLTRGVRVQGARDSLGEAEQPWPQGALLQVWAQAAPAHGPQVCRSAAGQPVRPHPSPHKVLARSCIGAVTGSPFAQTAHSLLPTPGSLRLKYTQAVKRAMQPSCELLHLELGVVRPPVSILPGIDPSRLIPHGCHARCFGCLCTCLPVSVLILNAPLPTANVLPGDERRWAGGAERHAWQAPEPGAPLVSRQLHRRPRAHGAQPHQLPLPPDNPGPVSSREPLGCACPTSILRHRPAAVSC